MATRTRSMATKSPRKAAKRPTATRGAVTSKASKAKPKTAPSRAAGKADVAKPAKAKLVRDSFTIPKNEYALLWALKERAARLARPAKKSELLRAGIALLGATNDSAFLAAVAAVPSLKTGRPGKKDKA